MKTRKSSGCVVWKQTETGEIVFLLVTRSNKKTWVLPKGGVEPDLTSRDSALKEVYEEAGALGHIGAKLGKYRYVKDGMMQKVTMYLMKFDQYALDWPEEELRLRDWFTYDQAIKALDQYLAVYIVDAFEHLMSTLMDEHEDNM